MAERVPSRESVATARSRRDLSPRSGRESKRDRRALPAWEDEDAMDVVAELLSGLMDACAQAFAARERVPSSLCWAREAILLGSRWRFPARDEGDADPSADWEEQEPLPSPLDAWTPGCVPIRPRRSKVSVAVPAKPEAAPVPPPPHSHVPPASTISTPDAPDKAVAAQPRKGTSQRFRPSAPRTAPSKPPVRSRGDPTVPGRLSPRPSQPKSAHVNSHKPPTPTPSGLTDLQPKEPPRSTGTKHTATSTRLRRPPRWIQPQVEVLDVATKAEGPARGCGGRGRSRGTPRDTRTRPIPLPPVPLRGWALAPGVTVHWGGRRDGESSAAVPSEEDEDAQRDLRPIRPSFTCPDIMATWLSGNG